MKKALILMAITLIAFAAQSQEQRERGIRRGLALYPFERQIGYRSNFYRKWFFDFKGGLTYSALPFFTLELNMDHRKAVNDKVGMYWGLGLTFDSYVAGVQVPIGLEVHPINGAEQFALIAEVNPKMTFGPANFLNINFAGHLGFAWYFRKAQKTE